MVAVVPNVLLGTTALLPTPFPFLTCANGGIHDGRNHRRETEDI